MSYKYRINLNLVWKDYVATVCKEDIYVLYDTQDTVMFVVEPKEMYKRLHISIAQLLDISAL